ncbi:hypothetical protein KC717_06505, partial [Candidatus Dojkabacteria bacterium]|nr:hypothetical protein [Candidatus Dojkabacteria bacterium]
MTEEKIEMENPKVVTNFISRYQNLVIHEADSKEALAKFYPIGNKKGGFATDDPEVIKKLTNRSDHGSGKGKAFSILKDRMPSFEDESIQKGAATSSDKQQIEAIKK